MRSFVQHILEPLYKLYSNIIGESAEDLKVIFKQLHIKMKKRRISFRSKTIIKIISTEILWIALGTLMAL